MGSTLSTAHRLEIRRALYLTPSDNKYARPQNAHLRLSKLRFFGLRSAAIKRGQRLLADYAERER